MCVCGVCVCEGGSDIMCEGVSMYKCVCNGACVLYDTILT